jgi:hypothetical protein
VNRVKTGKRKRGSRQQTQTQIFGIRDRKERGKTRKGEGSFVQRADAASKRAGEKRETGVYI